MPRRQLERRTPVIVQQTIEAAARKAAYLVFGVDAKWYAKRQIDGGVIFKAEEKGDARRQAEIVGYSFN